MGKDQKLRDKFGGSTLFGNEKDDSFKSSIGQIYQKRRGKGCHAAVSKQRGSLSQRTPCATLLTNNQTIIMKKLTNQKPI